MNDSITDILVSDETNTRQPNEHHGQRLRRIRTAQAAAFRNGQTPDEKGPAEVLSADERAHRTLARRVSMERDTIAALDRGRYLDELILRRTVETPPAPTLCFGDARREQMQIGPAPKPELVQYQDKRPERDASYKLLADKVAAVLSALPDVITCGDVAALLPDNLLAAVGENRVMFCISKALKAQGAELRRLSGYNGRRTLYVIRSHSHYAELALNTLLGHRTARTTTSGRGRPRNSSATPGRGRPVLHAM